MKMNKGWIILSEISCFIVLISLFSLSCIFAAGEDLSFSSENFIDQDFASASSIFVIDMDQDSDLDVIAASSGSNIIAWWEDTTGEGVHWFKHHVADSFEGALSAVAADMDGDGDLDILAAAETAYDIAWWENDGTPKDGGWVKHEVDNLFNKVKEVVAADLDDDGDVDIVGAAYFNDQIAWWENDGTPGNGGWTKHDIDLNMEGASCVSVIDMDQDGDLDVVGGAAISGDIIWYVNDGSPADGTWDTHVIDDDFFNVTAIDTVDMNGSGLIDVAGVADNGAAGIFWWMNMGSGGAEPWQKGTIISEGDYRVVAAEDMNLDGKGDVVAGRIDSGTTEFVWGMNPSSGSAWLTGGVGQYSSGHDVVLIDMDNDSDLDIFCATFSGLYWVENYSIMPYTKVPFTSRKLLGPDFDDPTDTCAVDMDRDGDLDILGCGSTGKDPLIGWWENNGDLTDWPLHEISKSFSDPYRLDWGDMDNDGDVDVLCASKFNNSIAWWENSTTGFFYHNIDSDFSGASGIKAADMDRDGFLDIVAVAETANKVMWWQNDGVAANWTPYQIHAVAGDPAAVDVADINRDGWLDVVATAKNSQYVYWYENNGKPTIEDWTQHNAMAEAMNYPADNRLKTGDIDNDGDVDILLGRPNYYPLFSENLDGVGGSWAYNDLRVAQDKIYDIDLADIDRDGDLDFFGADYFENAIYWFENRRGAKHTWKEHPVVFRYAQPSTITSGDFDGDGFMDLVSSDNQNGQLHFFRNKMIHFDPSYAPPETISDTIDHPESIQITDINGDGLPDVVAVSSDDNVVAWYENSGGVPPAYTYHNISTNGGGPVMVDTGDIDRDGETDILVCSGSEGKIQWFRNNLPGAWENHVVVESLKSPTSAILGDLNNDDWLDVIVARQAPVIGETRYLISSYLNDGTPTDGKDGNWMYNSVHASGIAWGPVQLAVADFDHDTHLDVAATYQRGGLVRWFSNDGNDPPIFTRADISTDLSNPAGIATGDMNGDGYQDIIVSAFGETTKIITSYINDGDPSDGGWFKWDIVSDVSNVKKLKVCDMDRDGDMDVLSNYFQSGTINVSGIRWYSSDGGSYPSFEQHSVTTGFGDFVFTFFDAEDIDNDGDMDIVASSDNDSLQWYMNRGGQFSIVTRDTAPETIENGDQAAFLKLNITHKGRTGDTSIEPAAIHLLLEESAGDPLTQQEAENLIKAFSVYIDDDSDVFESENDTFIMKEEDYVVEAGGYVTLNLPDRHSDMVISACNTKTYFIVVHITGWASGQTPGSFRITHITESSSTAQDRDYDINLNMSFSSNRTTKIVETVGTVVTPTPTPTPTPAPKSINVIMSY